MKIPRQFTLKEINESMLYHRHEQAVSTNRRRLVRVGLAVGALGALALAGAEGYSLLHNNTFNLPLAVCEAADLGLLAALTKAHGRLTDTVEYDKTVIKGFEAEKERMKRLY